MDKNNRELLLIVDDEPNNLQLMQQTLHERYQLAFATNGIRALRIVKKMQPNLILLDIMMPEMDGYEVCEYLKTDENTKDIPIIFITAMSDVEDETRGLRLGAADYITKPINPSILRARVKNHLALRQAREELKKQNRFIKKIFGRYLSHDVVRNILETPDGLKIGGERREVSIIMSDLRGFTALCGRLAPEDVVATLNTYLGVMIQIILRYGGTLVEIIGDGLFIVFGAPVFHKDHALRAVACAIEMQMAMSEVNQKNLAQGGPETEMGIGINTGEVVVGNIGSEMRMRYSFVGNAVNLAAHIESYTVGGQILISESTKTACDPVLKTEGQRDVLPKGIKESVTLYEVSGIGGAYNLYLPKKELHMIMPDSPLDISFCMIKGKDIGKEVRFAKVLMLGAAGMKIETGQPMPVLCNIKITLSDSDGKEISDALYAKVIHAESSYRYVLKFTSVPPEAGEFLS